VACATQPHTGLFGKDLLHLGFAKPAIVPQAISSLWVSHHSWNFLVLLLDHYECLGEWLVICLTADQSLLHVRYEMILGALVIPGIILLVNFFEK
jgi:hypothetical protein